ncbi:TPA: efflux RND transporter permease subunit [Aeromonas salmonicida]|uniref:Efflux pump membrane transporter n=2 Tax=Aeromonas salmonicida subsp. salmonicida TaxID=29491 RepID=A4SKU6_AERS4|nr:efflux RND transporter permease subunit [Aeromonas salmonicida]ABO89518.1 AcrB protein [Aeromonas salmonicida subsp. salmonicida A449]AYO62618.1 multidrug efflux RND transporter permease subunit [Aeromonas salmonicida subsp. salmonicida 01-B526]EHI51006.1 AcrB protein [Aeromonas salmonicida subsp. salmonicida 01-B526]EKP0241223.1 efflux RND transporter permease subunit [Aeromonas salmonicida]EKP0245366.1 efflux RND transporter permease subunit [Aeromonas salmonicida]
MARFFIDRPIFAWVIALVIMLAGSLAIIGLPIAQYPSIAPPAVGISASYPGASAKTVEDSVTQIIEQNMTGLDHLLYMSSQSDSSGNVSVTLTFQAGTDPDIAQVQVQNKLQQAMSLLPQEVQQQGIRVQKTSSSFLMVAAFISGDGSMNNDDLADYVVANIKEPLSRLDGVGDITLFGSQYSMRVWLDPNKLTRVQMTPIDVQNAIKAQNAQVAFGKVGGTPSVESQQFTATIMGQTRLSTVEEFNNILLRVNQDGSKVRLQDVARVELAGENYDADALYNGQSTAAVAIKLATGANALDTAEKIRGKLDELSAYFPANMKVVYPYDTTPFVQISIEEVVQTLIEAIFLVFCVMYLFLQNFRATLIPTIAVPVVLLGTFGVMSAFGFSINTLTMFGLVLAIGLLVDDAIVVVENVERLMSEEDLSPLEATRKSMTQITGALVGIALVLSAVFVPMAFFGGSTGAIYRQFSLTIVSAMVLSVLVALILTPALCATLLKPIKHGEFGAQRGFFGWFNRAFDSGANRYQSGVRKVIKQGARYSIIYVAMLAVLAVLFMRMPTSFLPEEDQGVIMSMVQLPVGATKQRTEVVLADMRDYFLKNEKDNVDSVLTVAGFSFAGSGQNSGMAFIKLKDWKERSSPDRSANAIIGRAMGYLFSIKEAQVFAFNLPPIPELGTATGFDFYLQDRAGLGHDKLMAARNQLLGMAAQDPNLVRVRPNGMEDTPQLDVKIDYEKALAQGLSISDINSTLSTAWGSSYVNDFVDRGRVKKVYLQADAPFRMNPEDLKLWYVRNSTGQMVPFSAFASTEWSFGSPRLERYNGVSAMEIVGEAAPGKSTGDAMAAIEQMVKQLPEGIGIEWTGLSLQERQAGSQAPALYAISLLVVFLCLAALYESWSIPFSVMLVVPLGVLGAILAATMRGLENDVYFQVGLLTTIGLSAKNAILIVEFAKELYDKGMGLGEAVVEAARLRPILMTSLAFILGVLPLVISSGAGASSRNAIGTGVMGGMISATVLAIFFVPLFFVLVTRHFTKHNSQEEQAALAKETHHD